MDKSKGKVKWYNKSKGFGFIQREDENDLFVHVTSLGGLVGLSDGDNVKFNVGQGQKGPVAVDVEVVS